jgi:hypothetical protein
VTPPAHPRSLFDPIVFFFVQYSYPEQSIQESNKRATSPAENCASTVCSIHTQSSQSKSQINVPHHQPETVHQHRSWCKPHIFYDDLNLGSYKVDDWDEIIENDDRMDEVGLKAILAETIKQYPPRNPHSVIPRFIRNVHVHYHNHQNVCIFIF